MNTITIGGKAGDGIKASGKIVTKVLNKMGYYLFLLDDYPSLIRGGHNFNKISFDKKPVLSHYNKIDVLIAFDKNTVLIHKKNLTKTGIIIYDEDTLKVNGRNCIGIPSKTIVGKVGGIKIMRNMALLGALSYTLGISIEFLGKVLKEVYPSKYAQNIEIATKGFEIAKSKTKPFIKLKSVGSPKTAITGNIAIAEGAVKSGLNAYFAYPMTPATSILHYLAKNSRRFHVKVVQPENEISVINMALGASYAGAKSMVGTSGGGFALMNEAVSLAGMSETPIVIVEVQRPGPSTGVPTYTSQADLNFVLNSGHGEFPKIVIAPGTNEQAFYNSGEALFLAWKFHLPVILVSDKHLGESIKTFEVDAKKIRKANFKFSKGGASYKRYKFSKDGISKIALPGTKDTIVKLSSYEHDEFGITVEDPEKVEKMQDKRFRLMDSVEKELENMETVKTYGKGKNVIVTWGSSVGSVVEAAKNLRNTKVLQIVYMKPFPTKKVVKILKRADKIACVEANGTGQLADLIKLNTGVSINKKILKYNSREFEPLLLLEIFKRWFK